jgi:hypothetical protein
VNQFLHILHISGRKQARPEKQDIARIKNIQQFKGSSQQEKKVASFLWFIPSSLWTAGRKQNLQLGGGVSEMFDRKFLGKV